MSELSSQLHFHIPWSDRECESAHHRLIVASSVPGSTMFLSVRLQQLLLLQEFHEPERAKYPTDLLGVSTGSRD